MKKIVFFEKLIAIISFFLIIASLIGGSLRSSQSELQNFSEISPIIDNIQKIKPNLYIATKKDSDLKLPENKLFISTSQYPSYGGLLKIAVVVNGLKEIEIVSILHNSDTSTYIEKIVNENILSSFLGKKIDSLPKVNTISGATLSSKAIIENVAVASNAIGVYEFQMPENFTTNEFQISRQELIKLSILILFFALALFISSKHYKWKKNTAMLILCFASIIVLGFMYSMQFSLSTLALFLSASWIYGIATIAPLACFVFAVVLFIITKKNLYCTCICPFGAIQECISQITVCKNIQVNSFMLWTSRLLALSFLCVALYFRNPNLASYEPFGRTFSFIGSTYLFALSFIVILSSLFIKRPWCKLLCPITPIFDYIQFIRKFFLSFFKYKKSANI